MMTEHVVRLASNGQGQLDDGRSFDRVLPGEEIEIAEDGSVRVVTPVSDRVKAPCRHFKTCGGCVMQHAADALVAGWKIGIVERALGARHLPFPHRSLHTSPPLSRRRAKFSGRRTKKGALVGFHGKGSDAVIDVPDCQLILPSIAAGLPGLEALTVLAASRKSEISLTVTDTAGGLDILVETDKLLDGPLRIELAGLAETHDFARLAWNDETVVTRKPPNQTFGPALVAPPPGAFLQATREGEAAIVASVVSAAGSAKRVVDLFCGAGTLTLPLATQSEVHGVEGSKDMLQALDRGWRHAQGVKKVTTEARDLFRRPLEPDELDRFDVAVLDPPRAGAEAQIATICRSKLERVVMVSCNPVTFVRDAEMLAKSGFAMDWVDVVDQFRWSTHIELVASFTRS